MNLPRAAALGLSPSAGHELSERQSDEWFFSAPDRPHPSGRQEHVMPETNKDGRFSGKVAFVTGAASGIGRAAALAFAREGAAVAVADVSDKANQETAVAIEALGGRVLTVRCDVRRSEDVKAALDQVVDAFGGLDLAFNNAGMEQEPQPAADISEEEWDRILDIDLRGVFLCMKHEIPL